MPQTDALRLEIHPPDKDELNIDDTLPPDLPLPPALRVATASVVMTNRTNNKKEEVQQTRLSPEGKLADSGANCCLTNNWQLLEDLKPLSDPITIGMALQSMDTSDQQTIDYACTHEGLLPIQCDNGTIIRTHCFYNKNASDTIISPQSIIRNSPEFTSWCIRSHPTDSGGSLILTNKENLDTHIALQETNGLFYCNTTCITVDTTRFNNRVPPTEVNHEEPIIATTKRSIPPSRRFRPTSKAKILESETWALRLGSCSETQLSSIAQNATGIPNKFDFHPFRYIDFREQARIQKQPVGRNPITVCARGRRFHFDFGFLRASTEDYKNRSIDRDRIVRSFDGYTSYLLIVDATSKYSWIFLTSSKTPPMQITRLFLTQFGHDDGGVIRVDQGGELARSQAWRSMVLQDFRYVIEPTGADSPSQNGQVERYNGLLATVVRTLLYSSGLTAQYWSVAAIHAVYLLNRRVHSGLKRTPYEAWWDTPPNLSTLRTFGSRVCVKVSGDRSAKLDRHNFDGIFVGYTATDDNIKYIDVNSGKLKTCHHAVFDEAWYLQKSRPPAAQLLFDMGMELEEHNLEMRSPLKACPAPWPPRHDRIVPITPKRALNLPLPLRISPDPGESQRMVSKLDQAQVPTSLFDLQQALTRMPCDGNSVEQIYLSPTPYHDSFEESLDLRGWTTEDHPSAGLRLIEDSGRLVLLSIQPSTPAAKIPRWRSRIKGAWLVAINDVEVTTIQQVHDVIRDTLRSKQYQCHLLLAHPELRDGLTNQGIPQASIDQLNPRFYLDSDTIPIAATSFITSGGVYQYMSSKLTRGRLKKQDDWADWEASEHLQLEQYASQKMFGDPVFVEDRNAVFHLVWTYTIKDLDKRKKARCTCDGSSRGGKARILDHTYANCVDHTASRLLYAISAVENLMIFGADVCNAFSEAPPPKQGFYLQPDQAFQDWWVSKGRDPIPEGYVIPVLRAMQGHPESPRLWEKWCDKMIKDLGFSPTTHEPCLYKGFIEGEKCYFKRQVDDFELAAPSEAIATTFYDMVDDSLSMPIKRQGLVTLFNGVDVLQTKHYVKISCETYIEKMSQKYRSHWKTELDQMPSRPLPIPTNESFLKSFSSTKGDSDKKIQDKLQQEFQFGYRSGVGELIFAMVTCRPDISTATVRCAQNSANPAHIHYRAVRHALKYLITTRKDGIYYWRPQPLDALPDEPIPSVCTSLHGVLPPNVTRPNHNATTPHVYVDADWATCTKTRRSMTGIVLKMAGGAIAYKTKMQPTVALSSTEAEFMAACDAGKMILFIRSILWDLGIPQHAATILYEDNDACTAMANAQKPTSRTRHMDIRHFALAEWVECDLMVLERIHTSINEADHMTKLLDRTLFYRHVDHIMGHIPPVYSPCSKHFQYINKSDDIQENNVWEPWTTIIQRCAHFQPNLASYPHWLVGGC